MKNWDVFQHYKKRSPPWVKLHRGLLDDEAFHCLPIASRALAPWIWLLASESDDGSVIANAVSLGFRFRMTPADIADAIQPLIAHGFLEGELQLASCPLAARQQDTILETEKEAEEERETEPEKSRAESDPPPLAIVAGETPKQTAPVLNEGQRRQYGRLVWTEFVKRRKRDYPSLVDMENPSPAEFAVVVRWMDTGVPLRVVLTAIETCGGKPRTLLYCEPAVNDEWQRFLGSRVA